MGCLPVGRPPPVSAVTIFILITVHLSGADVSAERRSICDVGFCYNLFELARETLGVRGEYPPPADYTPSPTEHTAHCVPMRTFFRCIQNMTTPCRGDLGFHSAKLVVDQHMRQFNCSAQGAIFSRSQIAGAMEKQRPTPTRALPVCSYRGNAPLVLCSVYGDPHVRAFDGSHSACQASGAWSLLDNDYVTLQATSLPLPNSPSSVATALTKLTLIVKSHDDCALDDYVTFQAPDHNGLLPSSFDDGRTSFGPQKSVDLRELTAGSHVEISLRFIGATLVIRRFGVYLSLTMSMPSDLSQPKHRSSSSMQQLCLHGCPPAQTLTMADATASSASKLLGYGDSDAPAGKQHQRMSQRAAQERCRLAKVVDAYFDSCVFDLVSTGDMNFTYMASNAMLDAIRLVPEELDRLQNRTEVLTLDSLASRSTNLHYLHRTTYVLIASGNLMLLVLLFC